MDSSKRMELIADLADQVVEDKFNNDDSQIYNEDYSGFTEQAQDVFNEWYDTFETIINKYIK